MGAASSEHMAALRELLPLVTPGAFYCTGEDNLRVISLNSNANARLTIVGRFLGVDGIISAFEFAHAMNTDRTAATTIHRLGWGWLLEVAAFAAAGTPVVGQTFVRLQIVRGQSGGVSELATLAQGVCTAVQRVGYPGSGVRTSHELPGALRVIAGTNPAAGVEISETVPTGARWELIALQATLVNSATVANRLPALVVDDGATEFGRYVVGITTPATATAVISWGAGLHRFADIDSSRIVAGIPNGLMLLAGHRIRTNTQNLQVTDDWGAPQFLVKEWLEGA